MLAPSAIPASFATIAAVARPAAVELAAGIITDAIALAFELAPLLSVTVAFDAVVVAASPNDCHLAAAVRKYL